MTFLALLAPLVYAINTAVFAFTALDPIPRKGIR